MTFKGDPMLFQGHEFPEGDWLLDDAQPDWNRRNDFRGIVLLHGNLVSLRRNLKRLIRGLCKQGAGVHHVCMTNRHCFSAL